MKSTSHSDTPTNDQQRPLRDRLLIEAGESFEEHSKLFLEAVDKIDQLFQHREATGCHNTMDLQEIGELRDLVVQRQGEIRTLCRCLKLAEGRLRQTLDTPNSMVLAEIANIKKEGGIE